MRVAILDAPALAMGWNSLAQQLRQMQPDYVAIGEEAVSLCQKQCMKMPLHGRAAYELVVE